MHSSHHSGERDELISKVNITIASVHGLFIVLFATIILCVVSRKRCGKKTESDEKLLRVTFYAHKLRWILWLILLFVLLLNILEGALQSVLFSTADIDVHVVNVVMLISSIVAGVFYHFTECQRKIRVLFILLIYSFSATSLSILNCVWNYSGSISRKLLEVKYLLSVLVTVVYVCLWFLDVFILLKKTYLTRKVVYKPTVDDLTKVKYVPSYTHFLSRVSFVWLSPLLSIGHKRNVTLEDLGTIPKEEESRYNYEKLQTDFTNEQKASFRENREASLWRCLWRMTRAGMVVSGFFKIMADLLMYVPPLCLNIIVNSVMSHVEQVAPPLNNNNNISMSNVTTTVVNAAENLIKELNVVDYFTNAYVISFICFVVLLLHFLLLQQSLFISMREGIRCKTAMQAMVFEKSLHLMTSVVDEGRVMNHMTIDPLHVVFFFYLAHFLWTLPITITLGLILLYIQLGTAALVCGCLILFMVPIQYFAGKRLATTQKHILEKADRRLKQSNELLQNIKLLKMYAWEYIFYDRVNATRKKELRLMLKAALYRLLSATVTDGMPFWACAVTLVIYVNIETEPLHPGKVFSVMSLFQMFANQLFITTLVINTTAQARISVSRIQEFLLQSEVQIRKIPTHDFNSEELNGNGNDGLLQHGRKPVVDPSAVYIVSNGKSSPDKKELQPLTSHEETVLFKDGTEPNINLLQPDPVNVLEIKDGRYGWSKDQPTLYDINIGIPKGKLTIIVGSVGSGKSSLLWAILGEMRIFSEKPAYSTSRFAVVPQKPWIINATIRENITLGRTFDEDNYQTVISASGLQPDLDQFTDGDMTEIGEKGANLSGGQRQRISIARALYSDKDVYLLDDALSALDAQVGSHVFENGIKKHLIENKKSVVLVTHHLHLLSKADHIIVMKHGRVVYQGGPEGMEAHIQQSLSHKQANKLHQQSSVQSHVTDSDWTGPDDDIRLRRQTSVLSRKSRSHQGLHDSSLVLYNPPGSLHTDLRFSQASIFSSEDVLSEELTTERGACNEIEDRPEAAKLIQEEEIMTGRVTFKYYLAYFRAATWIFVFLVLASYMMKQSLRMFADNLLQMFVDVTAEYSRQKEFINETSSNALLETENAMTYYLIRYSIVCAVCILLVSCGMLFLELSVLTASKNLHNAMIKGVVSAPMRFFDTTPIGRILNRLSADLCTVDEKMIGAFDAVLFCSLVALGGIVMNAVFVPYFIIPVIPLMIIYFIIQRYYITTCRELQRLDCVTKSPVLAHFSQALDGLSAIRTYRLQKRFQEDNWKKLDTNNITFLFFHATNSWVGVRLDTIGTCIVLVACVASSTSGLMGYIAPGTVGLVIGYAIMMCYHCEQYSIAYSTEAEICKIIQSQQLLQKKSLKANLNLHMCEFINWTMRGLSEVEMYFNNIQRIVEYSEIKPEPSYIGQEVAPDAAWPKRGDIKFEEVSLRYSPELECVVKNFSFHIKPGQKIGICGRTGSGKSSLTLSLFRLVDICEGRIILDDLDISKIPLDVLRSRLSIIPQEPILFTGSIRFNLDPLQQKSDADIWKHLKASQLSTVIENLPNKLDTIVASEGGDQFSIGQKQLICLARALLRGSQVLVMDEATASVDLETDHLIQEIVKKEFSDRTVITIAHRLSTIQTCDHIIVIQDGEKMEEGTPSSLAQLPDGIFARMLAENKL